MECGEQQAKLCLDRYNTHSTIVSTCYDRKSRFKTLVDRMILCQNGPSGSDPVWKFLHNKKDLKTPHEVFRTLQKSKLKVKHYDCIHIFTRCFTSFKADTDRINETYHYLLNSFDRVFHLWRYSDAPIFFSYLWLLRYFLENIDSPFVVFLKPRTSPIRHTKYIDLLKSIQSQNEAGNRRCVTRERRSRSDSQVEGSLRNSLHHSPHHLLQGSLGTGEIAGGIAPGVSSRKCKPCANRDDDSEECLTSSDEYGEDHAEHPYHSDGESTSYG